MICFTLFLLGVKISLYGQPTLFCHTIKGLISKKKRCNQSFTNDFLSFVNALPLRHMLQYRRELDQQMWCSPWYLFNSILKPPSYEMLSEWCPPNYVWTNLMVVSYQNETLCICFILEESPKVALVIDITEPLADIRSWDGEWLYYIVWPDHEVM